MNPRIKDIRAHLEQKGLDGLILSYSPNVSYLTELRSRDSYLIISLKKSIYLTDFRYTAETKKLLKGAEVEKIKGSVFANIADICRDLRLRSVGFEERYLSFAEYKHIEEEAAGAFALIPTHSMVEDLRQIKSREELEKIRSATKITVAAIEFIRDFISPGKPEIELAAEIERFIRYGGAYSASFEIIVASGPNSSFPHHLTGTRRIRNHEPLLIDIGVDYLGYKSDLTRVFFLGKINPLVRRVYAVVKEAQGLAIRKIKPGIPIREVDKVARQYIAQNKYGGFFGHNLGHGVGLEIHEAPQISGKEDGCLKEGMVFTIEPGIYLPGKFGVRIEDTLRVTEKGAEVLSGTLHK